MAARGAERPVVPWEEEIPRDPAIMYTNGLPESKASKRRRDLVTRIEKLREVNFAKREETYAQKWKELSDAQVALSINPPTHPGFLLKLHRESLKRDNELLAARAFHEALLASARAAYESEVRTVEDEYATAKSQAREKLLDSLDDRRRKLKDEKELVDFSEEALGTHQRTRANKGLRNRGGLSGARTAMFSRASSVPMRAGGTPEVGAAGAANPLLADFVSAELERHDSSHGTANHNGNGGTVFGRTPAFMASEDPLMRAVAQVSEPLRDSPVFHQLLAIGTQVKGRGGKRGVAGLPSSTAHLNIQPGQWLNALKSAPGLAPARLEDMELDLSEIRRSLGQGTKKRRGAAMASGARKKTRDEY